MPMAPAQLLSFRAAALLGLMLAFRHTGKGRRRATLTLRSNAANASNFVVKAAGLGR